MGDIFKDGRFNKLINDPKYRQIPKSERKVKIDKRFQSMFDSDKFKVKYTIDKRGRPVNQSSSENLKKYYDLSSEEESGDSDSSDEEDEEGEKDIVSDDNENIKSKKGKDKNEIDSNSKKDAKENEKEKAALNDEDRNDDAGKFVRLRIDNEEEEEAKNSQLTREDIDDKIKRRLRDLETDYARGEGVLLSDSSSGDETEEDQEEEIEHGWGELDADAETCDDATNRLAICNMDWDNINAGDLYVLLNSFLPPGGSIKSVTIYPSEFGLKRMEEEDLRGPIELTEEKLNTDSEDSETEEGSKYHMEKLRKYQLNRLKYYYAVAIFDSANTANKIYTDCDGIEYESSATKLDLRFVPDDVTFDQKIHDQCCEIPDVSRYKPRVFTTTALQQAKVELTWDAVNPQRREILKSAADGDINNEDLRNYLACSSSDEDIDEDDDKEEKIEDDDTLDPISKYKNLLQEIENSENQKKNRDVEMEISWGMGLKEKTEEIVKRKMNKGDALTPFEELVEKKKEKKKAKKLEKKKKLKEAENDANNSEPDDDAPSDIDMNDPYFAEEFESDDFAKSNKKTKKSKKKQKHKDSSEDEEEKKKRNELELLLDEDDDGKMHFSLKKIQEAENETKTKKKKKRKSETPDTALPEFAIDVNDERFSALYTSHHFNIDPTDPNFKKTKAMETLIQEKLKRRPVEKNGGEVAEMPCKKAKGDAAMNVLVNSIKRKTGRFNDKK